MFFLWFLFAIISSPLLYWFASLLYEYMTAPPLPHSRQPYARYAKLLKNKVVLVTGASQGIGKAIASLYAAHGAKVAIASRSVEKLEGVKRGIVEEWGVDGGFFR